MRQILSFILLLITTNSFCQMSSKDAHRLINELTRDYFDSKVILLDSIPCNEYLKIEGSYLQNSIELINSNLTKEEISFLLNFYNPTKCYLRKDTLENYIKLCDSTLVYIADLDDTFNSNKREIKSTYVWQQSQITSTEKRKNKSQRLLFSEPIVNSTETIMIVHIAKDIGKFGLKGETMLFKKLDNKWIKICDLYAWIT